MWEKVFTHTIVLVNADMFWDFLSLVPESIHQVSILFSNRGTPDGYRHLNGYSSHTLKLVDANGNFKYVKWHFKTDQGIKNLKASEAQRLAGENPDYATADLFNAIERGEYPSWSVYVQIMEPEDAKKYRFNPFDVTKIWSHKVNYREPCAVGKKKERQRERCVCTTYVSHTYTMMMVIGLSLAPCWQDDS